MDDKEEEKKKRRSKKRKRRKSRPKRLKRSSGGRSIGRPYRPKIRPYKRNKTPRNIKPTNKPKPQRRIQSGKVQPWTEPTKPRSKKVVRYEVDTTRLINDLTESNKETLNELTKVIEKELDALLQNKQETLENEEADPILESKETKVIEEHEPNDNESDIEDKDLGQELESETDDTTLQDESFDIIENNPDVLIESDINPEIEVMEEEADLFDFDDSAFHQDLESELMSRILPDEEIEVIEETGEAIY